mmetsp:Transcript_23180/g.42508  ORF Transcript_23180/g.42508 Transcript_23180/m.42508 type:complete len:666 (-) Transcript_23180:34-2031(-)
MKGGDGQAATEVRLFLREARPTWRLSQVIMAESKLSKVGISSVSQLLEVLSKEGAGSLNDLLIAQGEKTFTDETLAALQNQAASSPPKPSVPSKGSKDRAAGKPVVGAASANHPSGERMPQAPMVTTAKQEQEREQELRQRFERSRQQKAEVLSKKEAMRARAEAEEQLEDAMAELESCKENGWKDAVAEKELEVERLKALLFELAVADDPVLKAKVEKQKQKSKEIEEDNKQLAAQAQGESSLGSGSASSSAAPTVERGPAPRTASDTQQDVEWFNVVFKRVFVKKLPSEDAKSWGFIHQGQNVQVRPQRAVDERGREWVELTFFELFRSCLRGRKDRAPQRIKDDEQRGFCLVDASDMKLGALLAGPLPRSDWPEIDRREAEEYCLWTGFELEDVLPSLKVPTVESRATQQFRAVHELSIHEKPGFEAPVIGKKRPGTLIYAEKGIFHGWVKLAGEPGWVLFDISMDVSAASKARAAKAAETKLTHEAVHFQHGLNPEFVQAMIKDDELRLREVLAKGDEVPLETLRHAVERVRAFAGQTPLLRLGLQRLEELEREGESGRRARQLQALLAQAQSEKELRDLIRQCEDAGLPEVAMEARCALSKYLEDEARSRIEHGYALEELVAAIKTGNAAAIKSARDVARAAGVPKKELARAFALAQEDC